MPDLTNGLFENVTFPLHVVIEEDLSEFKKHGKKIVYKNQSSQNKKVITFANSS